MVQHAAQSLRQLDDVALHSGASRTLFERLRRDASLVLPPEHEKVLEVSNGIEAYAGYIRLFGVYTAESIDGLRWNQDECWKFAWEKRCSDFWCFAETGWGDQYAYSLWSLRTEGNSAVYFLDALSMSPRTVASSFEEFFNEEFLRSAREPYDDMTNQVRKRFGALTTGSHLVYIPSLLLGGTENITQVEMMDARAAMICNGDIAIQVDAAAPESAVMAVQPYEDELHRARLRLAWT